MKEQNVYLIKSAVSSDTYVVASDMQEAIERYEELSYSWYRDYGVQIDSITKVMTVWCK